MWTRFWGDVVDLQISRERRGEVLGEVGWESSVEVPLVYLDAGGCIYPGMMSSPWETSIV